MVDGFGNQQIQKNLFFLKVKKKIKENILTVPFLLVDRCQKINRLMDSYQQSFIYLAETCPTILETSLKTLEGQHHNECSLTDNINGEFNI